eukprot:388419_1
MGNSLPSVGISESVRGDGHASLGISGGSGSSKSTLSVGLSGWGPSISVSNEVENGNESVGSSSTVSLRSLFYGVSNESFVSKTHQIGDKAIAAGSCTTTVYRDDDTGKCTSGVSVEVSAGPGAAAVPIVVAAVAVAPE